VEGAVEVFNRGIKSAGTDDETVPTLNAKIRPLTMENDFLPRALEWIHGPRGNKR